MISKLFSFLFGWMLPHRPQESQVDIVLAKAGFKEAAKASPNWVRDVLYRLAEQERLAND